MFLEGTFLTTMYLNLLCDRKNSGKKGKSFRIEEIPEKKYIDPDTKEQMVMKS